MSNFNNPKVVTDKRSYGPLTWFVFAILPAGIFLFLVGYCVIGGMNSERILDERGRQVTATIVEARCDSTRHLGACRVKVSFYDAQGKSVTARLDVTRNFAQAKNAVAQTVPVTYDPQKPERARVALPGASKPYYKLVLTYLGYCLGLAVVFGGGAFVWYQMDKTRKK